MQSLVFASSAHPICPLAEDCRNAWHMLYRWPELAVTLRRRACAFIVMMSRGHCIEGRCKLPALQWPERTFLHHTLLPLSGNSFSYRTTL